MFFEKAFEAAARITAAAMEEAELELNAEGAEQAGDFFEALYRRLSRLEAEKEETEEKACRPGTFEVYRDAAREYRFRLKAANGKTVAASQGYASLEACLNGVESVKNCAACAPVKEVWADK